MLKLGKFALLYQEAEKILSDNGASVQLQVSSHEKLIEKSELSGQISSISQQDQYFSPMMSDMQTFKEGLDQNGHLTVDSGCEYRLKNLAK